jgi:hypothetical protein
MFWLSYGKLNRINRLIDKQTEAATAASKSDNIERLVNMSLMKEAILALRSLFVGFNIFFISCSFVWLAGK